MNTFKTFCASFVVSSIVFMTGCIAEKTSEYYREHPEEAKEVYDACAKITPDERYEKPECYRAAEGMNVFYWDKAPKSLSQ